MSTAHRLARNVICNWAGIGINMLAGFMLVPFLVHRLGETVYGLWILIASLTSYFGLLDLGVRGSVGRYVAYYRAKDDERGINSVLNTALALLAAPAALALLATPLAVVLFFRLIHVPADQAAAVHTALWIVGVNLALTFPLYLFDGILWGFERFDLINAVDIPVILSRTLVTFYLIGKGHGLTALALIILGATLASGALKGTAALRVHKSARLRLSLVSRDTGRKLFGYGAWQFMLSIARIINTQIGPWVVGAFALPLVTAFSIASRLVGYATSFLIASTGILTPVNTALHAREEHDRQQQLHTQSSAFAMAFALFFVALFIFMGQPLLKLWMGPRLVNAWPALVILAIGELLPMSQWATQSLLLGMARHRLMAVAALTEGALALGLIRFLSVRDGLLGVCLALSIAATLCRGIFPLIYGTRLVKMPLPRYIARAILKPLLAALPPAAALAAAARWLAPASWPHFLLYVALYALVYALFAGSLLGGYELLRQRLRRRQAIRPIASAAPTAAASPA